MNRRPFLSSTLRRGGRATGALAAAAIVASGLVLGAPGTTPVAGAQIAPALSVAPNVVSASGVTEITVSGANYLVPPHAAGVDLMGGVYVIFGWVEPGNSWGPSNVNGTNSNGQFGYTYRYPGESRNADTRYDPAGSTQFVSFTVGGASGGATPYHMAMQPEYPDNSRGSWTAKLTLHGSSFQFLHPDPAIGVQTINCLVVQCGVFTIGAHGVKSKTNEVFTPISFSNPSGVTPTVPPAVTIPPASGGNVTPAPSAPGSAAAPAPTAVGPAATPTTKKPTTTVKPRGGAAATTTTAAPVAVAGETTIAPEPAPDPAAEVATSVVEESTTTRDATTTTRASSTGSSEVASGKVIVIEGDGGAGVVWWALGLGTPAIGAASVLLWRRRSTAS